MTTKLKASLALAWMLTLLILGFYGLKVSFPQQPSPAEPVKVYCNQNGDELRDLFIQAMEEAGESIVLAVYALSDTDIIRRLNNQAQRGVKVEVIVDAEASSDAVRKLHPSVQLHYRFSLGLMHLKILLIDAEQLYLGSANFTTESLRAHGNVVVGLWNPPFAEDLYAELQGRPGSLGGYPGLEFYLLPDHDTALERLIALIDQAKQSIRIAMFTWTHPSLTAAVCRAAERGVAVEVVLDRDSSRGVSKWAFRGLSEAGLVPRVQTHYGLCHYKMAWIDEATLVLGSANWTRSAFTKNNDAFLVLRGVAPKQMHSIWQAISKESTRSTP